MSMPRNYNLPIIILGILWVKFPIFGSLPTRYMAANKGTFRYFIVPSLSVEEICLVNEEVKYAMEQDETSNHQINNIH